MKKNLFILIAASVLLVFSCKKEAANVNPTAAKLKSNVKRYAVKFGVSAFSQTVGSISLESANRLMAAKQKTLSDAPLSSAMTVFYYLVYDADGNQVNELKFDASTPGTAYKYVLDTASNTFLFGSIPYQYTGPYGTVQDSLAAGKYTVVLYGTDQDNIPANTADAGDTHYNNNLQDAFAGYVHSLAPWPHAGDIFYKRIDITVGSEDLSQNVELERNDGQLTIHIEDTLPANAAWFQLALVDEVQSFFLKNGEPYVGFVVDPEVLDMPDYPINSSILGKSGVDLVTSYVINTATPITCKLIIYDKDFQVLGTATIPNVQIHKNQRTILSGKVFTKAAQFTITANQAWCPSTQTIHF